MKRGYKHKTRVFGTDAEHYVSRLFHMMRNPNGERRPDLVSVNGTYTPRLSLEVKSGAKQKGVLNDYQLHYGITSWQDYEEIFGYFNPDNSLLPGMENARAFQFMACPEIAYYYNVINRVDGLEAKDLDKPYSAIRMKWGDQYIVPDKMGIIAFATAMSIRTSRPFKEVMNELRELIVGDAKNGTSHYEDRKDNPQCWQDIHGRDMLALFFEDERLTTKAGKERIKVIQENYPEIGDLKRIRIPAPNGSTIYALADPQHQLLFDKQVRKIVKANTTIIESVTLQRKRAEPLLQRIMLASSDDGLFDNGSVPKETAKYLSLSRRQIKRLERLVRWMDEKETEIAAEEIPF